MNRWRLQARPQLGSYLCGYFLVLRLIDIRFRHLKEGLRSWYYIKTVRLEGTKYIFRYLKDT